jgi:uncharacterized protein YbjT (DUF2867 family)
MKLCIFGSTSKLGETLILQALDRGHCVTAVARQPERLEIHHANLVLVCGDVLDGASLRTALNGQQAAVSVLGIQRGSGLLLAEGIANLVQALSEAGVRRFIYLSPHRRRFVPLSRAFLAEQTVIERCISTSRLDWTIAKGGTSSSARVAAALLDELQNGFQLRKNLLIE